MDTTTQEPPTLTLVSQHGAYTIQRGPQDWRYPYHGWAHQGTATGVKYWQVGPNYQTETEALAGVPGPGRRGRR